MDRIVLDNEQLTTLRHFIWKRGFREAEVVNEILDHFACKVEEVMANEPKLNLQEAMYKAHESFGVMGFAPIAAAYQAGLAAKRKAMAKRAWRQALTSIPVIVLAILTGICTYRLFIWSAVEDVRFVYRNLVQDILLAAYILDAIIMFWIAGWRKGYIRKGYFIWNGYFYIFIISFSINPNTPYEHLIFAAVFWGCIAAYFIAVTAVNYIIMRLLDEDNAEREMIPGKRMKE